MFFRHIFTASCLLASQAFVLRAQQVSGGTPDVDLYGQKRSERMRFMGARSGWWTVDASGGLKEHRSLTGHLSVKCAPTATPEAIAQRAGVRFVSAPAWTAPWVVMQCAASQLPEALAALRADADVLEVTPDYGRAVRRCSLPTDFYFGRFWHLKNQGPVNEILPGVDINVEGAWGGFGPGETRGVRGLGVRVGIVDDGVENVHPDLRVEEALSVNLSPGGSTPWPFYDSDTHGTNVAGLVAALANNASALGLPAMVGSVGVAPEATLCSIRLLGGGDEPGVEHQSSDFQQATAFAWQNLQSPRTIHVQNHSWGVSPDVSAIGGPGELGAAALEWGTAWGRGGLGTLYVFASGNAYGLSETEIDVTGDRFLKDVNYNGFASSRFTIAVGGVNDGAASPLYAQWGAALHLVAPCDNVVADGSLPRIYTTDMVGARGVNTGVTGPSQGSVTRTFSGTSAAAPQVSGVCALMLEANPRLGWRDVQEVLLRSAKKIQPTQAGWADNGAGFHFHHRYGAGLVDASAAVALAKTWTPLGPERSLERSMPGVVPIPDGTGSAVVVPFEVTASALRCEHVMVTLDIADAANLARGHSRRGQLHITLRSPSGMESVLMPAKSQDAQEGPIGEWEYHSLRHWGESATGTWSLTVRDGVVGSAGVLASAKMSLYGSTDRWTAPDAYETWLLSHFGEAVVRDGTREASVWGPAADPDGDSWPNLAEAVFGSDPKVPSEVDLRTRVEGNEFVLSWPVSSLGSAIPVLPQWSPDLARYFVSGEIVDGQSRTLILRPAIQGRQEARLTRGSQATAHLRLTFRR